jgi:hypothetical protein
LKSVNNQSICFFLLFTLENAEFVAGDVKAVIDPTKLALEEISHCKHEVSVVVSVDSTSIANYLLPNRTIYNGRAQTILHQLSTFTSSSNDMDRLVDALCTKDIPYFRLKPFVSLELRLDIYDKQTLFVMEQIVIDYFKNMQGGEIDRFRDILLTGIYVCCHSYWYLAQTDDPKIVAKLRDSYIAFATLWTEKIRTDEALCDPLASRCMVALKLANWLEAFRKQQIPSEEDKERFRQVEKCRSLGRAFLENLQEPRIHKLAQKYLGDKGYAQAHNVFVLISPLDAVNYKFFNDKAISVTSFGASLCLNVDAEDSCHLSVIRSYSQNPDAFPDNDAKAVKQDILHFLANDNNFQHFSSDKIQQVKQLMENYIKL